MIIIFSINLILCRSLLPALQEGGRHRDAANLTIYFNQGANKLIRILCDGHLYQDANFELNNQTEVPASFVRDHISEYAEQILFKVQADNKQFNAYVARLEVVRKLRVDRQNNGDDEDCTDFLDTASSIASSQWSGSSRSGRSRRSSKNRRKHERKLQCLKEGNPFEDIALIDALYTLSQKIYEQQPQIRDLLQSLIDIGLDAIAIELQSAFRQHILDITKALDAVWIPELMVPGEIKADEVTDYNRLQQEQHYTMISEYTVFCVIFRFRIGI